MNKLFYQKLAATNIKKNSQTYIPYILTSIGTVTMFYIMKALSVNKGLDMMHGSDSLKSLLSMGSFVVALFSLIFLFYTNSFLIKRRKKEFGLFNILGMEKKHLSQIMFFETLYIAVISLGAGLIGGILLSKLMYLVLLKLLNFAVPMGYDISLSAIVSTLILFGIIYGLTFINNVRQIHLAKPIELLKGGQVGEKEPKTKWLLTLIGLVCLGSGYYIALTTESPIAALNKFFIAVLLVIAGTYCLFTAGSIALLKLLRKNKTYYYKTKHFTSVSGMMYRMKQNAVGLANICILSTAVLVMLSTTVSLYLGMEDVLRTRYSRNVIISSSDISDNYLDGVWNTTNNVLKKYNAKAENVLQYRYLSLVTRQDGNTFTNGRGKMTEITSEISVLYFVPLEDYNAMNNTSFTLKKDEILLYSSRNDYKDHTLSVFDQTFTVNETLKSFTGNVSDTRDVTDSYYIIVKDTSVLDEIAAKEVDTDGNNTSYIRCFLGFDLNTDNKKAINISNDIRTSFEGNYENSHVEAAAESEESFYAIYGGLFFLGIFLGALFIMATVLIIYYKQISEGYDDKERFEIMQKVGMSHEEIKKSIRSQVLTVFFLPIVTAGIHIAFAFKVITKLLVILNLNNVTLFAWCTAGTMLVFAVFYGIIYTMTARVYYKIVS